jgi:hypothetical protein
MPRHCDIHYTPQSFHIHNKKFGVNFVIYILCTKKIAMMRDINYSNVRSL